MRGPRGCPHACKLLRWNPCCGTCDTHARHAITAVVGASLQVRTAGLRRYWRSPRMDPARTWPRQHRPASRSNPSREREHSYSARRCGVSPFLSNCLSDAQTSALLHEAALHDPPIRHERSQPVRRMAVRPWAGPIPSGKAGAHECRYYTGNPMPEVRSFVSALGLDKPGN